jgi:hypothetical protein
LKIAQYRLPDRVACSVFCQEVASEHCSSAPSSLPQAVCAHLVDATAREVAYRRSSRSFWAARTTIDQVSQRELIQCCSSLNAV